MLKNASQRGDCQLAPSRAITTFWWFACSIVDEGVSSLSPSSAVTVSTAIGASAALLAQDLPTLPRLGLAGGVGGVSHLFIRRSYGYYYIFEEGLEILR